MGNPFGGSAGSPPTDQSQSQQLMQSYLQNLPALQQANYQGTAQYQPQYTALGLQQLQQYGLPYAQAGQAITNSNAQAGAATNLAQIQGAGGQAATAATALNNQLNPVQATDNAQAQNLVNSINLNGLSGGEQSAVERSLNQSNYATGNLGLNNATNTVANAMQYGNALQAKRAALGSALGTANSVAANQSNQINPTNVALGQPATSTQSNFGTGNLTGTQTTANGNISGNQLLSSLGQIANTQLGAQATSNYQNSPLNAYATNVGSCCFIFLEIYNGTLPAHVRKCRDRYYSYNHNLAKGYIAMAKILVPLMKQFKTIKSLVNITMVTPLTKYGGFVRRIDGHYDYRKYRIVRKFWFTIWNFIGERI